ncbi:MAG TPA: hypothetical protein VHX43_00890 [Xanthobacteraceae bacterium]|jgi:hypothetical protein|nr:hypothetical protein [Xanthobacteraceae bacterium]
MSNQSDRDAKLRASLPTQVKEQPDPFLQMTTGHMGIGGVTVFAVVAVAILTVVLYGLNVHGSARPPSPAAAASAAPAAGGHTGTATPAAPQTTNNAKG